MLGWQGGPLSNRYIRIYRLSRPMRMRLAAKLAARRWNGTGLNGT